MYVGYPNSMGILGVGVSYTICMGLIIPIPFLFWLFGNRNN